MKLLLNQFIQFYKFFTQLEETDKEAISKEMNIFVERLNEFDFDSIDNQYLLISILIGDMEGKYTNFGRLYSQFVSFMYSINEPTERENNMKLLIPDEPQNFKCLLNTFLNFMFELNKIEIESIKENIIFQSKLSNDKEYFNKVKNNLDRFIPIVKNSIDDILIIEISKEKIYDIREKYITSSELAEILDLTRAAITAHRKKGYFQNTIQDAKKTKTQIPFKDIDKFCNEKTKYFKKWTEYKNNL